MIDPCKFDSNSGALPERGSLVALTRRCAQSATAQFTRAFDDVDRSMAGNADFLGFPIVLGFS